MNPFRHFLCILALAAAPAIAADGADQDQLQLNLPDQFYAVAGVPLSVYFDNVVLSQDSERFIFEVKCDVGRTDKRRWWATPTAEQAGEHRWTIRVLEPGGKPLATASTTLRVTAPDAGEGREIRLLIVGDSLTHATAYPNEIAKLLSQPGNPQWRMLGTHKPKSAADGVAHEGYGGWTWQRFVSQYEPNPDGTYRKRSSPFVFLDGDSPQLDVPRYLREACGGQTPDFVIFMLGINDCFSASPDNPDPRIDAMLRQAEILLTAFRQAAPKSQLGVCLTTPPNSRDAAFEANYKGRYPRWGWKRIQHRLVQRQIQWLQGQSPANAFMIPAQLNLDPVGGYPDNNAVHPNAAGYQQIGASLYGWLKFRLAAAN